MPLLHAHEAAIANSALIAASYISRFELPLSQGAAAGRDSKNEWCSVHLACPVRIHRHETNLPCPHLRTRDLPCPQSRTRDRSALSAFRNKRFALSAFTDKRPICPVRIQEAPSVYVSPNVPALVTWMCTLLRCPCFWLCALFMVYWCILCWRRCYLFH
jgi:hypothetical protein